jgi:hypothetical protein
MGVLIPSAIGCSSAPIGQAEESTGVSQDLASCPSHSAQDDQMRAAATVAFNLMRDAAKVGGATAPVFSNTVLASQRYRVASSGGSIEFDPNDPLYPYVTNQMKADLAVAQQDATVAKFLADGLKYDYANSNGQFYPSIRAISALANFKYPGPTTVSVPDPTSYNNSHTARVTGQSWCRTSIVTINETVQQTWQFSPLFKDQVYMVGWLSRIPSYFTGSAQIPTTPFNGSGGAGNPYLVVTVNGATTNWATYNFNTQSCYNNPPPWQCQGSLQIDPVPYAEPGQYYDTNTNMVGTQANPFDLSSSTLYAVPDHATQWATRTVNSTQQWGTFTTPVTLFGVTFYKYAKQF